MWQPPFIMLRPPVVNRTLREIIIWRPPVNFVADHFYGSYSTLNLAEFCICCTGDNSKASLSTLLHGCGLKLHLYNT